MNLFLPGTMVCGTCYNQTCGLWSGMPQKNASYFGERTFCSSPSLQPEDSYSTGEPEGLDEAEGSQLGGRQRGDLNGAEFAKENELLRIHEASLTENVSRIDPVLFVHNAGPVMDQVGPRLMY